MLNNFNTLTPFLGCIPERSGFFCMALWTGEVVGIWIVQAKEGGTGWLPSMARVMAESQREHEEKAEREEKEFL